MVVNAKDYNFVIKFFILVYVGEKLDTILEPFGQIRIDWSAVIGRTLECELSLRLGEYNQRWQRHLSVDRRAVLGDCSAICLSTECDYKEIQRHLAVNI